MFCNNYSIHIKQRFLNYDTFLGCIIITLVLKLFNMLRHVVLQYLNILLVDRRKKRIKKNCILVQLKNQIYVNFVVPEKAWSIKWTLIPKTLNKSAGNDNFSTQFKLKELEKSCWNQQRLKINLKVHLKKMWLLLQQM